MRFSIPPSKHDDYEPVHVYPHSHSVDEINNSKHGHKYATVKRFHMVRHAEGTHNVHKEYSDLGHLDARLTECGKEQCTRLACQLQQQVQEDECLPPLHNSNKEDILVVTSPLTRCMETAILSFPTLTAAACNERRGKGDIPKKFVALESLRETVNYACDRRRVISDLEPYFHDHVCFREIRHDHDEIWEAYERRLDNGSPWTNARESAELHVVADRAREFWTWIRQRPEQHVVVCTHSAFLRCMIGWGQPGGVEHIMEQYLDERGLHGEKSHIGHHGHEIPVLRYCGNDEFEAYMRRDYENCELRSFIAAFPHGSVNNR